MPSAAALNLAISRPDIGDEERAAVDAVLTSGHLAAGPQVRAFEEEFAAFCGAPHALAVSSGTAALQLALAAVGVRPGWRVGVPTFTFAACANAVLALGAEPVFVDLDDDFGVGVQQLTAAHVGRLDAVLPVHLYGRPLDLRELRAWAARENVRVVEDACQAHGAHTAHEGPPGSVAPAAYSFYATKNMTTGEGGAVVCPDEEAAESVMLDRNHGMRVRYQHERPGLNLRMTDLQAALGRVQLRRLPGFNARRRENAQAYDSVLGELAPRHNPGELHVYHQYTVRVPDRDAVRAALAQAGVGSEVYYPLPLHLQPAFAGLTSVAHLPRAERAAREVLSLPVHPGVTPEEALQVGALVREEVALRRHVADTGDGSDSSDRVVAAGAGSAAAARTAR